MKKLNIEVCGKWILSGEHTVLRGGQALVFPLVSKKIRLKGEVQLHKKSQNLKLSAQGELSSELPSLFLAVLSRSFELLKLHDFNSLCGELEINNSLPFGSGLGASASLCVMISQLLNQLDLLPQNQIFSFARQLENFFHGESSGVDIAVTLEEKPILFQRQEPYQVFTNTFFPPLALHYTGRRGITRECIEKVKKILLDDLQKSQYLDQKMQKSVELGVESFKLHQVDKLIHSLKLGCEVFREWGLIEPLTENLISQLYENGALAVKPTGSGLGGYLLALWPDLNKVPTLEGNQCIGAF